MRSDGDHISDLPAVHPRFSDEIHIEKNNIRLCDTLEYAKNGTMDAEMRKLFDLLMYTDVCSVVVKATAT